MTESVKKDLKDMNVDRVTTSGACTKYIQAPDVCWNNPFKARTTELYDQWFSGGVYQSWSQLSTENIIKSFNCCGLNLANDGMEDDFIHCLKKGQPCEAGRQKLNSQLSILTDESDVVNPFIFHFAEEHANEEMNLIEDERDEEIIM